MYPIIRLYTVFNLELENFFKSQDFSFSIEYNKYFKNNNLLWEKTFENYNDLIDLIIYHFETYDDYNICMWISFDEDVFIKVHQYNSDQLVRYIYIRYLLK